jgi:uncharacterized membrane protein YdjX (TVP38/TMEM64 family)
MLKRLLTKASSSLLLLLYLSVAPALLGGAIAGYALHYQDGLSSLNLIGIATVHLGCAFLLALGWMPTTFFSLLCGYLWGWKCLPFLVISYLVASFLGYYLCRRLDNGRLANTLEEKFPVKKILAQLQQASFWLAVFCRLSPALPFAVMNALFAMSRYPLRPYFLGGTIGMLPRTIFALFLGERFSHVTSMAQLKSDYGTWLAVVLVVLSFVGIGWVGKKQLT